MQLESLTDQLLHAEELLIQHLRKPQTSRMIIRKTGNEVSLLEVEKTVPNDSELSMLIKRHPFQTLSILIANGRVAAIKQTVKIKPDRQK